MSTLTNELNQKIEQTKKFFKNIKGTMEAVVKNYIGRHIPIKFHIGQDTSSTNEKTIDIVIQPEDIEKYSMDEIAREVRFLVGHESQHIKSSVLSELIQMTDEIVKRWMKVAKDNVWAINVELARDISHYIGNSLEDGRIENIMCNDYPGLKKYRKWFRLNKWMDYNCKDIEEEKRSTVSTILNNILFIATTGMMSQGFEEIYTTDSIEYKKTMEVLPYIRQAVAAPTCKDCLDAAKEICYILEDIILNEICITEINRDEIQNLVEEMEQMNKQMNEQNFGNGQNERLNKGPVISILDDEERKSKKTSQNNANNYILDLRKEEPKKNDSAKNGLDENNSSENDENTDSSQNSENTSKSDENSQNESSEDNTDGTQNDNTDSDAAGGSNSDENRNGNTNNSSNDKNSKMSQSDAKNNQSKSSDDSDNNNDSKNEHNESNKNGQNEQGLDGEIEDDSNNSGTFGSDGNESNQNDETDGTFGSDENESNQNDKSNGLSGSDGNESNQNDETDGTFGSDGNESNQNDETDGTFGSDENESNQNDETDGTFGSSENEGNQGNEANGTFGSDGNESNQDDEADDTFGSSENEGNQDDEADDTFGSDGNESNQNDKSNGLSGSSENEGNQDDETDGTFGSDGNESNQNDEADGTFGSDGNESNQNDKSNGLSGSSENESNQNDDADGTFGSDENESDQDDEADGTFGSDENDGTFGSDENESDQDDEADGTFGSDDEADNGLWDDGCETEKTYPVGNDCEENSSVNSSKESNSKEGNESGSFGKQKSNTEQINEDELQKDNREARSAENTLGEKQEITPDMIKKFIEDSMQAAKDKTFADAETLLATSNAIEIAETERREESGDTSLTIEETQKIADKFGGRSYQETRVCEGGYYPMIDAPASIKVIGENIHSRIENIINSLSTPDREEVYEGEVDVNGLFKLCIGEYDVFREDGEPREADIACFLLKDNSGSMSGNKEDACCEQLAILEEGLRGLVKMKIASFADWGEVEHFTIKDWEDEDTTTNFTWSYHNKMKPSGGNHDAYSIMIATQELLKRPENQKLLIVLSDGAPCCNSADVRAAVRSAREQGVFVISIFFGYDNFAESNKQYYQDMYEKYYIGTTPDKIGFHLERLLEIFMETA